MGFLHFFTIPFRWILGNPKQKLLTQELDELIDLKNAYYSLDAAANMIYQEGQWKGHMALALKERDYGIMLNNARTMEVNTELIFELKQFYKHIWNAIRLLEQATTAAQRVALKAEAIESSLRGNYADLEELNQEVIDKSKKTASEIRRISTELTDHFEYYSGIWVSWGHLRRVGWIIYPDSRRTRGNGKYTSEKLYNVLIESRFQLWHVIKRASIIQNHNRTRENLGERRI